MAFSGVDLGLPEGMDSIQPEQQTQFQQPPIGIPEYLEK